MPNPLLSKFEVLRRKCIYYVHLTRLEQLWPRAIIGLDHPLDVAVRLKTDVRDHA